jgi:hypothetical protein
MVKRLLANPTTLPPREAIPAIARSIRWDRAEGSSLWIPSGSTARRSANASAARGEMAGGMLASTYMAADEILQQVLPAEYVAGRLGEVAGGDVLVQIARILVDVELHTESYEEVDERWARQLFTGDALDRVQQRLAIGSRLIVPQLLLIAAKLALLVGGPGVPSDSPNSGVAEAILTMLSVADFLGARDDASLGRWGGLPTGLACVFHGN